MARTKATGGKRVTYREVTRSAHNQINSNLYDSHARYAQLLIARKAIRRLPPGSEREQELEKTYAPDFDPSAWIYGTGWARRRRPLRRRK